MLESQIRQEISKEYNLRFANMQSYRDEVWKILTRDFFQHYIRSDETVLDLGCGWGEFINNINAGKKYAMDMNPSAEKRLNKDVIFINQNCSAQWELADESLDVVFTSNFFEHLPSKDHLRETINQANRCLKSGGRMICLGPNIKYVPGAYWDFWDHYIPLTEMSLSEILEICSLPVKECRAKFLPYTMSNGKPPPLFLVKIYLRLRIVWNLLGKQFFILAEKP